MLAKIWFKNAIEMEFGITVLEILIFFYESGLWKVYQVYTDVKSNDYKRLSWSHLAKFAEWFYYFGVICAETRKESMILDFLTLPPLKICNSDLLPIPSLSFYFEINFLHHILFKRKNFQYFLSKSENSWWYHPCLKFL